MREINTSMVSRADRSVIGKSVVGYNNDFNDIPDMSVRDQSVFNRDQSYISHRSMISQVAKKPMRITRKTLMTDLANVDNKLRESRMLAHGIFESIREEGADVDAQGLQNNGSLAIENGISQLMSTPGTVNTSMAASNFMA